MSRIGGDIETLEHFYVRVFAPPVVAALVAVVMWFFMGRYDPRLGVTTLVFLALAGIGVPILTRALSRGLGRRLVAVRSELNVALVDGVQGVAELLTFGADERQGARVAALSRESAALQERMARIGGLGGSLTGLLMNLATLAALVVAIPLVTTGELDGVFLAVIALAVIASFEAVVPLPSAALYLGNSLEAGRRLFEIVDAEPEVRDPPGLSPAPRDYGLWLKEVRFCYQPDGPPALDGVSFHLPHGGSLAVVGPSGAGKSTLVNLLLRFWDYDAGHITLGGRELRAYQGEDLRGMIGVVSQHTHLFNATVRDNLLLARPDAGQIDVERAAREAQIHDFVASLPDGKPSPSSNGAGRK